MRFIRAGTLALAGVLAGASVAYADTVPGDANPDAAGPQPTFYLGTYLTGQSIEVPVGVSLTCAGSGHANEGETVAVALAVAGVPLDGTVTATPTTIGPVPASWPDDGAPCPSPTPVLASNGPSTVTLTMPTTPGLNQPFILLYSRSGASDLTDLTLVTLRVDVIVNTPPTLTLPASLTVEGTTTGGANVSYDAGATDLEDDPEPTPVCSPASGSFFPLGPTTVTCDVTDAYDATASGSFQVTVVDTTAPNLAAMGDVAVTTDKPDGAAVTFDLPAATDAVDPDPSVACAPLSGSLFAVGSTTVECTGTDASGNSASTTFRVDVTYDPGIEWSVAWGEPVGGSPATLVGNQGRTVPVKVEIFANGTELTSGDAAIRVDACGGGTAATEPLAWGSGRWSANLDTTALAPGCYLVTAVYDGSDAGSFALELRGAELTKSPATKGPKK
ncbi:MAG TPA: HYR domain-containing protein [Candidatus Limnocylindrales bacterium]|nr:HYR domain-containing protein [Candidatus Limnocylindrales bacterium]